MVFRDPNLPSGPVALGCLARAPQPGPRPQPPVSALGLVKECVNEKLLMTLVKNVRLTLFRREPAPWCRDDYTGGGSLVAAFFQQHLLASCLCVTFC